MCKSDSETKMPYDICHLKHASINLGVWWWELRCKCLIWHWADNCSTAAHTHTDVPQWWPFLGPTQRTSRACLRRDSGASETAWQICAWPPQRKRKGANRVYIFVFNPPYTPHWFSLTGSSECRLHVCIYRNKRNTKNMVWVSDISALFWGL